MHLYDLVDYAAGHTRAHLQQRVRVHKYVNPHPFLLQHVQEPSSHARHCPSQRPGQTEEANCNPSARVGGLTPDAVSVAGHVFPGLIAKVGPSPTRHSQEKDEKRSHQKTGPCLAARGKTLSKSKQSQKPWCLSRPLLLVLCILGHQLAMKCHCCTRDAIRGHREQNERRRERQ